MNPVWADAAAYIELLNLGFPGQWNRAAFEWYLRREFAGQRTDIAVRTDQFRIVSVAAYCYRQVREPSGRCVKVCVMAAGATLPSERGRGHYSALLQTGLELCREHACAALLGFTTRQNASARGLMRLGAYAIPSFYIVSDPRIALRRDAGPRPLRPLRAVEHAWQESYRGRSGEVQFHYAARRDWLEQFVQRPNPVSAWRVSHDSTALIETVGSTDRLQWLGCPRRKAVASIAALASASAAAHRNFFMYTVDPLLAAAAGRLGLAIRGGFVLVLPIDRTKAALGELLTAPWGLQSGDRM